MGIINVYTPITKKLIFKIMYCIAIASLLNLFAHRSISSKVGDVSRSMMDWTADIETDSF